MVIITKLLFSSFGIMFYSIPILQICIVDFYSLQGTDIRIKEHNMLKEFFFIAHKIMSYLQLGMSE
jgi:hypothetical protein